MLISNYLKLFINLSIKVKIHMTSFFASCADCIISIDGFAYDTLPHWNAFTLPISWSHTKKWFFLPGPLFKHYPSINFALNKYCSN